MRVHVCMCVVYDQKQVHWHINCTALSTNSNCANHSWCQMKPVQHHWMLAGPCKCIWVPPPHNLIGYMLLHYHMPGHFIQVIHSLYTGLTTIIFIKQWETQPVHLAKGQPTISCHFWHYHLPVPRHHHIRVQPIPQYADDTCLTASSKANCQAMLDSTQKWLDWSLLKPKVPKCTAISICSQTG